MNHKQAYLGITVFMLLVSCFFVPTVISDPSTSEETNPITIFQETTSPSNMSITLQEPIDDTTFDTAKNVSFIFYPAINGSGQITGASLWINGERVSYNQTEIVPWQNNTIYHQISKNGTYLWSIKLENSENAIIQSEERTLTVEMVEEIAVELVSPQNDATITNSFNVSFVFIPKINSSDYHLTGASLYIDDIRVEDNQTAIVLDEENVIHVLFSQNGSHRWNIRLHSSSENSVFAPDSYNFTLAVAATSPTPTPTATTTTPTPPPTTSPTFTATPSPTPDGPGMDLDLWTLIIVAVIVFAAVLLVTIFLLRRRAR